MLKAGEGVFADPGLIEAIVKSLTSEGPIASLLANFILQRACQLVEDTAAEDAPGDTSLFPPCHTVTRGKEDDTRDYYRHLLNVGRLLVSGGTATGKVSWFVAEAYEAWESALGFKVQRVPRVGHDTHVLHYSARAMNSDAVRTHGGAAVHG
jgi:hypothetical protein